MANITYTKDTLVGAAQGVEFMGSIERPFRNGQGSQKGEHIIEGLATLFPSNWPMDIPLARIHTCGHSPLSIEVLHGFEEPASYRGPRYAPPDEQAWQAVKARRTALTLLSFLASQPHCFASQDALSQALCPSRGAQEALSGEDLDSYEDRSLRRADNVVTDLRHLLYPPALAFLPKANQCVLRRTLIRRVKASFQSGLGYALALLPLVWLDVEVMEAHASTAATLDEFGDHALEEWRLISEIGFRGAFLPHETYSDWARWRRSRTRELLWQSVTAQVKAIGQWEDQDAGDESALRLLSACWQAEPANEDAFRALAEKLARKERFQQVEECYAQLCAALSEEGYEPHKRTHDVMEFVRAKKLQRKAPQSFEIRNGYMPDATKRKETIAADMLLPLPTVTFSMEQSGAFPGDIMQLHLFSQIQWKGNGTISDELQIPLQRTLLHLESLASEDSEQSRYSRRQILVALAALPFITLSSRLTFTAAYIAKVFLPQCATSLVACNQLMKSQDFLYAEQTLARLIAPLRHLAQQETHYQAAAAHLAAQCYLLFGILESHNLNWAGYKIYNEHAVEMSKITGDASLQAVAIIQLAMTFFQFEQPNKALTLYEEANPLVALATPLVRSDFYVKQAVAYAQAGQAKQSQECLEKAHAAFPTKAENDPSFLYADFGSSSFICWETTTQLQLVQQQLAKPEAAWKALAQSEHLPWHNNLGRTQVFLHNLQAETALAANEMEQFIQLLTIGIRGANYIKSKRRLQQAMDCFRMARQQWPNALPIQQLADVFVETALTP